MIVKCRKIINVSGEELSSSSSFFTIGKEYVVLGFEISPKWGLRIFVLTDEQYSPAGPFLLGFEIISQKMPDNWEVQVMDDYIFMLPANWSPSFLQDVDEGDPKSVELFYKEAELIYQSEGLTPGWKN